MAAALAAYLRLCWRTTRWTVEDVHRRALIAQGGPLIAAFWHGRLAFSPFWVLPDRRTWAVISANRDGALISAIVGRFGVGLIRGSSHDPRKPMKDKRGRAVMVESLRALRAGDMVGIAIDGPRGPRMRAQPGAAALSATAQAPVLPIAFATRRGLRLRSWDRFVLPLPFDSGVTLYGAPLAPPAGDAPEQVAAHLARIEAALTALTRRADAMVGRTPVEPGAPQE